MIWVALSGLATFGQAIAGDQVFQMAGLGGDPDAAQRFRRWLAGLLFKHLSTDGDGDGDGPPTPAAKTHSRKKVRR